MYGVPCLCDGRIGMRCDEQYCDLAGPGAPDNPNQCRVCWLRLNQPPPAEPQRAMPCLFLGDIVDQRGCACPARWLRECVIHHICTLDKCKSCPQYEAT